MRCLIVTMLVCAKCGTRLRVEKTERGVPYEDGDPNRYAMESFRVEVAPCETCASECGKVAEAYGWLWHITTSDERVKLARHCLFSLLSYEERGEGIKAAKALGARVNIKEHTE